MEQLYEGEVNEAAKWRAWFFASTILYSIQFLIPLGLVCSGFFCFESAYENIVTFWCFWIFTPVTLMLSNIGFNIWATVIRFNGSGRKCADEVLSDTGHFMTVWISVTYGV